MRKKENSKEKISLDKFVIAKLDSTEQASVKGGAAGTLTLIFTGNFSV